MKRLVMSFLPLLTVACAVAQTPVSAPTVTETGRVSRFLPGPGDRPQGVLLRNGTFVTFSPGLAQRLPASLPRKASVQVVGEEFTYDGSKGIQAQTVTIAGTSYNDPVPLPGTAYPAGRPGIMAGPAGAPPPPGPNVAPLPPSCGAPPPLPPQGAAAPAAETPPARPATDAPIAPVPAPPAGPSGL